MDGSAIRRWPQLHPGTFVRLIHKRTGLELKFLAGHVEWDYLNPAEWELESIEPLQVNADLPS